ncbi:hypothetical protein, partial [Soonwooa sp.]|uniref:hypothetical protein n=1 Tax=Soonwooa sp. TaxID=1938592 RepID=UPI003917B8DC
MRREFYFKKIFALLLVLVGCIQAIAQEKPNDSVNIKNHFNLASPIRYEAFYDVKEGIYYLYPKIGNTTVGNPLVMTFDQYRNYMLQNQLKSYFQEKSDNNNLANRKDQADAKKKGLLPSITIRNKIFENIFGSNKIELIPQGYASFDLGVLLQKIENPLILPQNRNNFTINIQQRMQLGLTGKVGENLQLKANYDTQSGFA